MHWLKVKCLLGLHEHTRDGVFYSNCLHCTEHYKLHPDYIKRTREWNRKPKSNSVCNPLLALMVIDTILRGGREYGKD